MSGDSGAICIRISWRMDRISTPVPPNVCRLVRLQLTTTTHPATQGTIRIGVFVNFRGTRRGSKWLFPTPTLIHTAETEDFGFAEERIPLRSYRPPWLIVFIISKTLRTWHILFYSLAERCIYIFSGHQHIYEQNHLQCSNGLRMAPKSKFGKRPTGKCCIVCPDYCVLICMWIKVF